MAFRTFILLYRHRHSDSRHFHHPRGSPCPRAVTPHSFRQCRAASPLLSASMDLATLGTSHKRTHMMASILSMWFLRVILAARVTMSVRAVLIDSTYEQFPPRQAQSQSCVTWGDALCPATLRSPTDSVCVACPDQWNRRELSTTLWSFQKSWSDPALSSRDPCLLGDEARGSVLTGPSCPGP